MDIPGATGGTYTLGPDDVGSTIRVVVTAVNAAGSSSPATSRADRHDRPLAPSNITPPAPSAASPTDGQTLTATLGGWSGTGPLDYDVQWQRCDAAGNNCADIAGATAWSYMLTARRRRLDDPQRGHRLQRRRLGHRALRPDRVVAPRPPVNTVAPGALRRARATARR